MNRSYFPVHISLIPRITLLIAVIATIVGCGGSGTTPQTLVGSTSTTQNFGSLITRIIGSAQSPVTSSAANGANVTGIAGALIDQMTLNFQSANTLADTKLAFVSNRDSTFLTEIYTMNPDGTGQTRLTNNGFDDLSFTWSPDGSKIAFETNRDGNFEIYTMNADGTNPVRVTNNASNDLSPSWSPDGTKIAFQSFRDQATGEIYTVNADGTGPVTRVTNNVVADDNPVWSPDGSKFVFYSTRDQAAGELYTMNVDGSNVQRLTNNVFQDLDPSWSPDGTRIVFHTNRDGNYEIYTMYFDGTGVTRLTNNAATDEQPTYSPDGTKIAFTSTRDGNFEIYTMNVDGSNPTRITYNTTIDELPTWSTFQPRLPKTLVGAGGSLGTAAAGFLFGQRDTLVTSVLAFDTNPATLAARSGARVVGQTASETQGTNLIFSLTTTTGLGSVSYVSLLPNGRPGTAVNLTIPTGSTGALVSFSASLGTVTSVIPFAANRSQGAKRGAENGNLATYVGHFTAVFDSEGKNLAPNGATSVTLDEKNGKLVKFDE
jgi:hypothetical protein